MLLLLDQVTKRMVISSIPYGTYHSPAYECITDFLYLVHIGNDGAAWGMFSGYGQWLALLGVCALISIYFLRHELQLIHPTVQIAFGLLIGGICGNLIDRMLYGHVVDFVDVHLPLIHYRWPAFNVADSGIFIGVWLYLISSTFFIKQGK